MATTINIKPVEITKFPEQKIASKVYLENPIVNIVDNGVYGEYILMDENDKHLYYGNYWLKAEEVAQWTTTDTQLVEIILNKLKLEKEE